MASSLTAEKFLEINDPGADHRLPQVRSFLERAESLILAYVSPNGDPARGHWIDSIMSTIQHDVVNRVYHNPAGLSSDSIGGSSQGFTAPGGVFLLPGEKEQLDRVRTPSPTGGLGTIGTTRRFWV